MKITFIVWTFVGTFNYTSVLLLLFLSLTPPSIQSTARQISQPTNQVQSDCLESSCVDTSGPIGETIFCTLWSFVLL